MSRISLVKKVFNKFNDTHKLIVSCDPNINEYFIETLDESLTVCVENLDDQINNFINMQLQRNKHSRHSILIIDDHIKKLNHDTASKLFCNSRHYGISFIYHNLMKG